MIRYLEDFEPGQKFGSGELSVEATRIKSFAAEFDPQPYHLDDAAAEQSMFKGLAASGWHTAAMSMRLAVEARPFGPHPLLGLGVDELRWLAPVRPGDVIRLEGEVTEVTPSKTRPQGTVKVKWTAYNQDGTAVYTFLHRSESSHGDRTMPELRCCRGGFVVIPSRPGSAAPGRDVGERPTSGSPVRENAMASASQVAKDRARAIAEARPVRFR